MSAIFWPLQAIPDLSIYARQARRATLRKGDACPLSEVAVRIRTPPHLSKLIREDADFVVSFDEKHSQTSSGLGAERSRSLRSPNH